MKPLFTLLVFLVSVHLLPAQSTNPCIVNPILLEHYDLDVKHLALKRIYDLQAPPMDSIIIPQSYQDTIWQGLAAIFNLTASPPRDTVFDIYCIHQYGSYYLSTTIFVRLDPLCLWQNNWKNLITHTGIQALDGLLSTFGYTVTEYWAVIDTYVLTTIQTINARPVADSLETFNDITFVEAEFFTQDGDKINYSKTGTSRFYNFTIGWADCPAGCQSHKTLQFQVHDDCSVQYLGSNSWYSEPIPHPVNCNISVGLDKKNQIAHSCIYPNPVEDVLNIETDYPDEMDFSVLNVYGQCIKTGQTGKNRTVAVDDLPSGLYILLLKDAPGDERFVFKFVKK